MTHDEIIRMAREAKLDQLWGDDPLTDWSVELTSFAALVAAVEREACAQIADEWATHEQKQYGNGGPGAAIRARGEE